MILPPKLSVLIAVVAFGLVACGALPTEQQIARRYEHRHPGTKVLRVTQTTEGVPFQMKARFHVSYTEPNTPSTKSDIVRYHQVAEGWVEDLPRQ